jgi:hypothetical protein
MDTLLITCNPGALGLKRQLLIAEIYKFSATMLTSSVYAIQTDCTPKEIFQRLEPFIGCQEILYVAKVGATVGRGDLGANAWLETNLNGGTLH